jgi:hypothetical protein
MALKSGIDTPAMERRIRRAFLAHERGQRGATAVFEHGHWWVTCRDGSQYSVEDATGGPSIDGFDFECVTDARCGD